MTMVLTANTDADALSGSLDKDAIIIATGTLTLGTQVFVLVDSTITAQALTGTDLYAPLLTDTSYVTPTGAPQHKPSNNFCVNGNDAAGIGPCTMLRATRTIKENIHDVILPA